MKVIVVDDDWDQVNVCQDQFQAIGNVVNNIPEAVEMVKHFAGDDQEVVVLLDYLIQGRGILPQHFKDLECFNQLRFFSTSSTDRNHPLFSITLLGRGFVHYPGKFYKNIKKCLAEECDCATLTEERVRGGKV